MPAETGGWHSCRSDRSSGRNSSNSDGGPVMCHARCHTTNQIPARRMVSEVALHGRSVVDRARPVLMQRPRTRRGSCRCRAKRLSRKRWDQSASEYSRHEVCRGLLLTLVITVALTPSLQMPLPLFLNLSPEPEPDADPGLNNHPSPDDEESP